VALPAVDVGEKGVQKQLIPVCQAGAPATPLRMTGRGRAAIHGRARVDLFWRALALP